MYSLAVGPVSVVVDIFKKSLNQNKLTSALLLRDLADPRLTQQGDPIHFQRHNQPRQQG